ncbi:TonB-dependent receptor domain-containing protein [Rufibacter immobilis]|uniref:TonB-dependent receptor domain-containing protein n=1 Tax=Rufibacter immobilis TaxID=1348778 RepID=UPI0035ECA281
MKKRALSLLGLLCLCVSFSVGLRAQVASAPPVSAQGAGKIYGVLQDSISGKAIEYATVALMKKGTTTAADGTMTNAQGQFTLSGVAPGDYSLSVTFIGYKTKVVPQVTVTNQKPEVNVGTVKLTQNATQLKEVTVQGLRPTIRQEADKMVVSVEGTALAAGRTAYDVLAKSPGVFIDQDGNIQLNGRSGVTIMLDGKLTYLSAQDLRSLLEGMPAENLKNIEIIANPSSRFDAEGASGILNINLKKNELRGMNGSVYAGFTHNFKQYGYTAGGNIYQKAGKWNSFLNLDLARRVFGREATFTRIFYAGENATYYDQETTGNARVQGPPSIRIGTDYSLTDKHSVGIMAYYVTNKLKADFLTDTYIGNAPNQPQQFIEANNFNTNTFTNRTLNLHYLGKLDTTGTTLSADLDLVKITNRGYANFYNYRSPIGSPAPPAQDFLYTNTPSDFNIFSMKVDYSRPYSKTNKLELGLKASRVRSDNDSRFYFNNHEGLVPDPSRSNHFLYDENIYAAYANWNSKVSERYTIQTGLRAEYTQSTGESLTTGQVTPRDYLSLFPSIFVQQKVSENYQVNYSYSRRLQRPNYGNLNPFISYRDPYTYWQGNPYLRPQFTHAFGVTQTFRKDYSLELNYQIVKDVIAEVPLVNVEDTLTVYTIGNVDKGYNLSLTANVPVKVMKNWDTQNTLLVSYNKYNLLLNQQQQTNDRVFYMLQSNHNILLPLKLKMEINFAYRGPGAYSLYEVDSQWWLNVGFKRSFLEDKLDVSLNANDIFKSQRVKVSTIGENVNAFDQYFRTRNVGVTLRYNFSKGQKFDPKRQNTSLDEVNRT